MRWYSKTSTVLGWVRPNLIFLFKCLMYWLLTWGYIKNYIWFFFNHFLIKYYVLLFFRRLTRRRKRSINILLSANTFIVMIWIRAWAGLWTDIGCNLCKISKSLFIYDLSHFSIVLCFTFIIIDFDISYGLFFICL